jgi:hypothetical protein
MKACTETKAIKPPHEPHREKFLEIAQDIRRAATNPMSFEEALSHAYRLISPAHGDTVQ